MYQLELLRFQLEGRNQVFDIVGLTIVVERSAVWLVEPEYRRLQWDASRALQWSIDCAERALAVYRIFFPDDRRPWEVLAQLRAHAAGNSRKSLFALSQRTQGIVEQLCHEQHRLPSARAAAGALACVKTAVAVAEDARRMPGEVASQARSTFERVWRRDRVCLEVKWQTERLWNYLHEAEARESEYPKIASTRPGP